MSEMKYQNHRKKWTVKETKQLLKETRKISDLNSIALIHKRSPYAIYLKLVKEASKIADEDYEISLEDLSGIVGLKSEALLDGFKKIKYDFKNHEDDNYEVDDYDSDDEEDEVKEVKEVKKELKEEKKLSVLDPCTSIIIILINLSGMYYFLMMNKLL